MKYSNFIKGDVMNLDSFLSKNDEVLISNKDGHFTIFSKNYHLVAESHSIEDAYSKYREEKKKLFLKLESLNSLHVLDKNEKSNDVKNSILKIIFERFLIFSFSLLFSIILIAVIFHKMEIGINKVKETFFAKDNLKKEERLERFKANVDEFRPYIKELKKVYNEE